MGLGYSGRVPGGMMGRVGVDGGGISPGVHESGAGREWVEDRCRTVDNGSIESGLESSYMERFDAERNAIIRIADKKETFQVRSQRRECHPVATRAGMECRIKKTGESASASVAGPESG